MNRMLKSIALFGLVAGLISTAWAVNKCTGADGKISYQEAACTNTVNKVELASAPCCTATDSASWQFERSKDSMTGIVTCFATSPKGLISTGPRGTTFVDVQIALRKEFASILIRSDRQTDIFHHKLDGMGIKVEGFNFMPITQKTNANAVGFANLVDGASLILSMFPKAKSFQLRLRFWPWDGLNDTFQPISLKGFTQAFALADACAKKD